MLRRLVGSTLRQAQSKASSPTASPPLPELVGELVFAEAKGIEPVEGRPSVLVPSIPAHRKLVNQRILINAPVPPEVFKQPVRKEHEPLKDRRASSIA